jgi:hypothetical protein
MQLPCSAGVIALFAITSGVFAYNKIASGFNLRRFDSSDPIEQLPKFRLESRHNIWERVSTHCTPAAATSEFLVDHILPGFSTYLGLCTCSGMAGVAELGFRSGKLARFA